MSFRLFPLILILAAGCTGTARIGSRSDSGSHHTLVSSTPDASWPKEHTMVFEYLIRDGSAVLQAEEVVLVFPGLTTAEQRVFRFGGTHQAIQIAGHGSSSVEVSRSLNRITTRFNSTYANGTNTLQFGSQTVQFTEAGKRLWVGGEAIDLSPGRKVVHLRGNTATVE